MNLFNGRVDFCVNHDIGYGSFSFQVGRFSVAVFIDGEADGYRPLTGKDSSYQCEFTGGECRGAARILIDDNEQPEKGTVDSIILKVSMMLYAQLACFSTKVPVPFTPENLLRAHQWCESHQDFLR